MHNYSNDKFNTSPPYSNAEASEIFILVAEDDRFLSVALEVLTIIHIFLF
jgi:hypothetical protein